MEITHIMAVIIGVSVVFNITLFLIIQSIWLDIHFCPYEKKGVCHKCPIITHSSFCYLLYRNYIKKETGDSDGERTELNTK